MIEFPSLLLAVLPSDSAVDGRAVTLYGNTNIDDMLKSYYRVFSTFCKCVDVSFSKRIFRLVQSKTELRVGISRLLRSYEAAAHLAIIIF